MKKCPICDLNYITDDAKACVICKPPDEQSLTLGARKAATLFKTQGGGKGGKKGEITQPMVEACYEYAKQVHWGRLHITDAVNEVARETGMNKTSAQRMIYDSIGGLFEGRKYASVMSASATVWLLEAIKEEYGEERFQTALKGVKLHLDYYEQLPKGSRQRKIRDYVNSHMAK